MLNRVSHVTMFTALFTGNCNCYDFISANSVPLFNDFRASDVFRNCSDGLSSRSIVLLFYLSASTIPYPIQAWRRLIRRQDQRTQVFQPGSGQRRPNRDVDPVKGARRHASSKHAGWRGRGSEAKADRIEIDAAEKADPLNLPALLSP